MTGPKHQQSTQLAKPSANFLRTSQEIKQRVVRQLRLLVRVADHLLPHKGVNIAAATWAQVSNLQCFMQCHFNADCCVQVATERSMVARTVACHDNVLIGIRHKGLYPSLSQSALG